MIAIPSPPFATCVDTKTGFGNSLQSVDNLFALGTVLQRNYYLALNAVFDNVVRGDIAFVEKYFSNGFFHIRRGDFYRVVFNGERVSDAREHICNRICHFIVPPYQLAFLTPGICPLYANSLKQIRHTPYFLRTA